MKLNYENVGNISFELDTERLVLIHTRSLLKVANDDIGARTFTKRNCYREIFLIDRKEFFDIFS